MIKHLKPTDPAYKSLLTKLIRIQKQDLLRLSKAKDTGIAYDKIKQRAKVIGTMKARLKSN